MADLMGRKNVSIGLQSETKPEQDDTLDEEISEDISPEALETDVPDEDERR
jgi:hypothetical protein